MNDPSFDIFELTLEFDYYYFNLSQNSSLRNRLRLNWHVVRIRHEVNIRHDRVLKTCSIRAIRNVHIPQATPRRE
jgi:hypothetical protein